MIVDLENFKIQTDNDLTLELFDHEYWTLLPTQPISVSETNPRSILQSGIAAHNIKIGKGLLIAMEDLLDGIKPCFMGNGPRGSAEETLEGVRLREHPDKPSRLRCHFLFHDHGTAKQKQVEWQMSHRFLTRCYVVLNSARFHHADIEIYDSLTSQPNSEDLAKNYWSTFRPISAKERARLEVLTDSCLYFPDWPSIPNIVQN